MQVISFFIQITTNTYIIHNGVGVLVDISLAARLGVLVEPVRWTDVLIKLRAAVDADVSVALVEAALSAGHRTEEPAWSELGLLAVTFADVTSRQ